MILLSTYLCLTSLGAHAAAPSSAQSMLSPAPIFADHMVLPRGVTLPIFGLGTPGRTVEVQFGAFRAQTVVRPEGTWKVSLPPKSAGGPFLLKIKSGGRTVTLHDVMVGDVWLCSGQSNMEWPVSRSREVKEISAEADQNIRLFRVVRESTPVPAKEVRGTWHVASPKSVGNWSAIGLSFALQLRKTVKVPIGLIQATWGGTKIEAWTSQRALESDPRLKPLLDEYFDQLSGFNRKFDAWQEAVAVWDEDNQKQDPGNQGYDDGYARRDFKDQDWSEVSLPAPWEQDEAREVDGAVWYRHAFQLPENWVGKGLRLELGFISDNDQTYMNGLKIGSNSGKNKSRSYYVGPGALREGNNVIAVRVWNKAGEGGILGPNLRLSSLGGGPFIDLSTTWRTRNELAIEPPADAESKRPVRPMGPGDRNAPSGAFQGMIAPLIPYGIKGIIWYQGEANVGEPSLYRTLFPCMIADWRTRWGNPNLPFYFVQLPGYRRAANPEKAEWAELREAQESGLDLPYVGMAVSVDFVDPATIHPIRKREVGRRLANLALAQVYKQNVPAFSPSCTLIRREGNNLRCIFINQYGGLKLSEGNTLRGFEIRLNGGEWTRADASIGEGGVKIILPSDAGRNVKVEVRYAWADDPDGNLVNITGLPAIPFRMSL